MPFEKKTLNLILLTIAVSIWLYVFYNIVFSEAEEETLVADKTEISRAAVRDTVHSIYLSAQLKDPFRTPYNTKQVVSKPVPKKTEQPKEEIRPPHIVLLGVVSDKSGPMAILQYADGNIYYVREQEKILDITIIKICDKQVIYEYKKTKQGLNL